MLNSRRAIAALVTLSDERAAVRILQRRFFRLGQNYDLEKSQEMLEEGTLLATHPDMPSFKLKANEARMLFDYLRSIQE